MRSNGSESQMLWWSMLSRLKWRDRSGMLHCMALPCKEKAVIYFNRHSKDVKSCIEVRNLQLN